MGAQKAKSHIEVVLDKPFLTLKGTGPDVEPTTLSGHVALYLADATDIKEIKLEFRGKARTPMPSVESLISNTTYATYTVCEHDWSFLEESSSTKRVHAKTLKAGRHLFPFTLPLTASLPSSIYTPAFNTASVNYKLRAVASRPGLAHNLTHTIPVHLLRTFTPEALEYQQTLEIENTWPGKLMYAIMIPHKAWAAGDDLIAVMKFSPLEKGVRVETVTSMLWETTKVFARSGHQEEKRMVRTVKHAIIGGKAVELTRRRYGVPSADSTPDASRPNSRPGSPLGRGVDTNNSPEAGPSNLESRRSIEQEDEFSNNDIVTHVRLPIPISWSSVPATNHPLNTLSGGPTAQPTGPTPPVASLTSPPDPLFSHLRTTPSHSLEPIAVSHRVRWSVLIRNADGHASELRCSLPVHILDNRLYDEARSNSRLTRRMVFGTIGLVGADFGMDSEGADDAEEAEAEERELPSYTAHVRDRVANMFLPETATTRMSNPWIGETGYVDSRISRSGSPTNVVPVPGESPGTGIVADPFATDGVAGPSRSGSQTPEWIEDHVESPHQSGSAAGSSRSASPDRRGFLLDSASSSGVASSAASTSDGHSSPTDGPGHGVRHFSSLLRVKIKPFTTLTHHHHGAHSGESSTSSSPNTTRPGSPSQPSSAQSSAPDLTAARRLHSILSTVPDYTFAARGFLGGVPPLTSANGLPSYAEAQRTTIST